MPVIRVNKSKDYVTMSNYHFKEKDMTLKRDLRMILEFCISISSFSSNCHKDPINIINRFSLCWHDDILGQIIHCSWVLFYEL